MSVFIIRALRLSRRSRRRRMARASRRVTASDVPISPGLAGSRPLLKMRTPDLIMAQGWFSALSLTMAQPSDVEPRSSASL